MVHFVGAGPGAEDLITIRGQKYLQTADVIIYAGSLVNPALLCYAKEGCQIYDSAKLCLEEVLAIIEQAEAGGLTTVRLHTGDPSVFGAIREQMDALKEKHIAYDLCPGVSSMFGAAAALGCEYTLPDVSQSVIITRAEGRTPVPERESLSSFAAHQATMVLFLSSGMADKVQAELLEGGYREDTPVGIVYKATWPEEKTFRTTLGNLSTTMDREGITKTALIIVGDVLGDRYEKSKLYDAGFSTEYRPATVDSESSDAQKDTILMLACSKHGYELMLRTKYLWEERLLGNNAPDDAYAKEIICKVKCADLPEESDTRSMTEIVKAYIPKAKAIIFFTATGIAVRTMASFLKHKSVDPAVLAVDEMGKYCISVLSGHVGGANVLAQFVSGLTGATPVVTTATDLHDKFSVDSFAKKNGLVMTDWTLAKEVSAAVLRGEKIGIDTDCEIQSKLPDELVLIKHETNRAEGSETRAQDPNYEVRITADMLRIYRKNEQTLVLVPKCYVVGVGCKSNTPESAIYDAVKVCMDMYGADMRGLAAVASIDGKAEEPGLVAFCKNNELPFMTYDAQTLNEIEGDYSKSQFVMDVMGVDNVCERSAMACAKTFERVDASYGQAEFICRKTAMNGVTVSIVRMERKISL